jgi:hypothetical protein
MQTPPPEEQRARPLFDGGTATGGIISLSSTELKVTGAQAGAPKITLRDLKQMKDFLSVPEIKLGPAKGEGGTLVLDNTPDVRGMMHQGRYMAADPYTPARVTMGTLSATLSTAAMPRAEQSC